MFILTPTQTLTGVLDGAASTEPTCVVTYFDSGSAFSEGSSLVEFTGATPIELVGSPLAETNRIIGNITLFNADTAAHTITLTIDTEILSVTLAPNETFDLSRRPVGGDRAFRFTLQDPASQYTLTPVVRIEPKLASPIVVTGISVGLDTVSYDIDMDLKYADAPSTLANPVTIATMDTTSGVYNSGRIAVPVPAGKCLYVSLDATPDANILQASVSVAFHYTQQ